MKRILLFIACAFFASGVVNSQTITVTSPNGGETWAGCSVHPITWTHSGTSGFFNVEYSTDNGGNWASLATNFQQSSSPGSFSWTVPNLSSTQALVRIYQTGSPGITDQSNANFTITPALLVTSPNGGESWQVGGGSQNITWTAAGTSNYYNIDYSVNAGSSWTNILTNSYITSGSYTWTIPNNPSTQCLVRVQDYQSSTCKTDNSDNLFTIAPPTPVITVTSPNGGNTLYIGQNTTINWTTQYAGSFVKIEYSTDNGGAWTTVTSSTSNNGSYSWTNIPNTPSNQCLIKISDVGTPSTFDVSDAVFNIVLGTITVTSPNGGESWISCSNHSVTWTRTGTSNYFNVYYSINGGTTWQALASNYYQSGGSCSFSWTLNNTTTSQARVLVTDYNNSIIRDSSDANFTIIPAVTVTAPNGGESWQGGTTNAITWTQAAGASNYWTIQYSINAGTSWTTIITNTYITSGTYNWSVPNNPSTQCLVRVYDYQNSCKTDDSDNLFTITAATPVINVTSPNGGETRYVGGSYSITWTYAYVVGSFVSIDYSTNNGSTWTSITNSTSISAGSYTWNPVPNTPSTQCLVRVSEFGNPSVKDSSNAVFSIIYPYVVVNVPNGGESWNGCSSQNITWSYAGTGSPSWQVQYSLNNGSTWNTLTSSTTSSSYNWNPVLDTSSSQALVRVTRTTDTLVRDTSNAVFTLNADNSIVVSSPNGGESWQVNNPATRAITWSASGTSSNYNLFYSTNGGTTWTTITTYYYNTSANPTYTWTIPNSPSTNCLIKIEDSYNTCKNDLSNAVFTIVAPDPVITVTSPNGGETRFVGGSYNITWTYQYVAGSFVKIEYSTNNGSTWTSITNSTSISTGSYTWNPVPNTPSTLCLVKVSEFGNPSVKDSSNNVFSIVYPSVTVTAPNTGVTWQGCTSQNITWSYSGTGSPTWSVNYSADNGATWNWLTNTTSSSYNWNPIPNTITTSQALVKVFNISDANVVDSSDVNFTISPVTYIIINSPNGGESWQVNNPSTRTIQWSVANTSYTYNLYYSTNGGTSWTTITTGYYNTSANPSYTWTVPNAPSTNCLIKIEDYYASCKSDQSDAVFTILAPTPVITVTSPNGGNIYYVGTGYNISWTYQYVVGSFVQIDYSINNGTSWLPVIASTAISTGSYTWSSVPNTPSNNCLVRIRSTSDTTVVDSSNSVFSIVYPYVVVGAPNGGESWAGCSSQTISWSGYGTGSGPWKVEYSIDSGATWTILTSGTSSSSYSWSPVPNTPTTKGFVRVTKTTDALVKDSSNTAFTILQNTAIILSSPNGGEVWQVNNPATRTISWTASGTSYYYNLYYSTNGGTSWTAITTAYYNTSANPTYNWTIPNVNSTNCLFKVEDYYNTCKFDNSDAVFTITPPTPVITVTTPNGGNTYYVGTGYNITWTYQYVVGSFVKIEYSVDSGATWATVTNSTSISSGSYTWSSVPNTPSTKCYVKVSEFGNPSVKDSSDLDFNIVYPYVVVTSPNGGESWNGCSAQSVSWSGYGTGSGPWKVEYSIDSGLTWMTLTSSTTSSSYSWNPVPNTPSNKALVKVTKTTDTLVKDMSNAVYAITQNTAVIVTSPNGGESWQVANPSTRSITWTASGTSYYYNLYYSTNGGSTWTTITTYYYNTSPNPTYTWTIPNTPSANCLVKIEDYSNSCKYDISDAVFTIVAPTPVITVTNPNGGNAFYVGTAYNITWNYQYVNSSFVKIEYSTDNGNTWSTITNSTAISSSYSWTVPNTPSTQCLVKVSEFGNPSVFDVSNAVFSIVTPYITVNSPNGGETWNGCTSQSISWSGYGVSGPYKVEYSTDNGVNYTTLVSSTSSSSYTWNPVPNSQSNNTLIRVSLVSNSSVYDESNAVFTISQQTYIIVNTPNGGESWQVNNPSQQIINWAFAGTSNYFNLYYSINGGSSWSTIATYVSATGGNANYNWTIPNNPSTNCLIKIEDYYNTCKYDESNAPFTIVAPTPYITVTNPNGGNTLYSFNTTSITWTSGYLSGSFVKLDYSIDSGATWVSITSSYSNTGSYSWTIPNVNSTKCLVKVTDFGNNATYDISDAVFTIKPAVTVTAPNGGEQLGGCTVTTITWTGESSSGNYLIQYSLNGGSSWTSIVSQLFSGGPNFSYNWTLPNTPSDYCLIKVTNTSNTSKVDQSDAVFSIVPTIVVTNPSNGGSFAVGSSLNITWSAQGVSNYYNIDYSTNGGSTWTNIAFNTYITTNSYSWTVPNSPSTNCLIKVTDYQASCKQDLSDLAFTIATSPASITVTSPNGGENWTACSTKNITWSANSTSGVFNIQYSSNGGSSWSSVVSNLTSSNGVYSWTLPAATTTQGLIKVTDSANVLLTDQSNSNFTISNLATPGTISGNTTVCQGSAQTYSVGLVAGATSYTWTVPSGWTGSSTSNTITVSAGSASGNVSVVANNICGSSSASNLTVTATPLPATPGAITGNTTPCTGISQTYSIAAVSGATSYSWTLPSGYSGSSSTTSISVLIGSNPGSIQVVANNGCGSGSPSSLSITPNGNSLPNQPGNITGPTYPCNASTQGYSIAAVPGATSYTWTLPGTWTGTSSTNSINAVVGSTGGNITVTASNTCGTSPAQTLAVGVDNVPGQPGTISGNASVCQNSSNTYSITSVSGATSYTWTLPAGWTGASNSTSIVTTATGSSGNISVTANNSCGSSAVRNLAVTVNTPVTPSVAISQSPSGTQCGNTNITFTATPTNGGTPSYQWYKNGLAVGLNASSYSNASWTNGDSVWVVMTTSLTCVTGTAAASNKAVLSITATVTPSIAVTANATSICLGQTVNFTTSVTNGGTTPTYQWRKNGSNIAGATASTYSTSSIINGDAFTCIVTSNAPCASPISATSNSVVITTTVNVTPSVSIAASPGGPICTGGSVTFTATPVNGGSTPTYQWTVNGQGAGNTNIFTTTTLNNGDTVKCVMTSSLTCVTSSTANSNSIIQTVNDYVDPIVTASANNNPICIGQNVTFTATPTYGGTSPSYQWRKNHVNIGGANASTYATSSLSDLDTIDVIITSNYACLNTTQDTSNEIVITVTTSVLPDVTVSVSPNDTVCSGTNVTFTATPLNGGSTPTYQWRKNGVNIGGATSSTYSSASLLTGDAITVVMTSSASCASPTTDTSAVITMQVNSNVTASVSITADEASPVCSGTAIKFTAAPVNGGSTPAYQWKINGVDVSGETNATFTTSSLANGDAVTVAMTSSAQCATPAVSTSNTLTYVVNTLPPTPGISASGTVVFCDGGSVTLTSSSSTGNSWSNSATTQAIVVDTTGSFTVTVTDLNGCSSTSAATNVTVNPNPSVSVSHTDVSCFGYADGNATANASGGTTPYSYLWSNAETTSLVTGLADGDYSVTVTDSYSCSASDSVSVSTTTTVTTAMTSVDESCNPGNDGTVTVTPAGGTTPYTYLWSDNQTLGTATGLVAGTYSVTVTEDGGCMAVDSSAIVKDASPVVNVGQSAVSICDNDSAALSASGADSYSWSPATGLNNAAGANPMASPDNSTTYVVTGTVSGCTDVDSVVVTVNPIPAVPTISLSGPSNLCPNDTVTLSSSYSSGNTWSNTSTTQSINVSAAGTFTVSYVDGNGCSSSSAPTVITQTALPAISAGGPVSFCSGGSVTLTSSSSSGNTWITGATSQSILVDSSGLYSVTVDDGTCVSTSNSITVTENPLPVPTVSAGGPTTFCAGGSVTLTSSASSGNSWSPNGETTTSINVTTAGTYSVTETDGNGCIGTSSGVTVTVVPAPAVPTISASGATTFCAGGSVTLTSGNATGNIWSPFGQTTQSILVSATGSFIVSYVDSNGCSSSSAPTLVTVNPLPTAAAGADTNIIIGNSVVLNGTGGINCSWSPATGLDNSALCNPTASPSVTTTYVLSVIDGNGCSDIDSVTVNITIPNPPVADFTATNLNITTGSTTDFLDLSSNNPTSWLWSFPGGTPSSSTSQNPAGISYSAVGCYDVTLIVSNAGGSDTVTKTCYINVTAPLTCGANPGGCPTPSDSVVVGSGTSTIANTTYPNIYGNWYWGSRHQLLYTAAELQAMGFSAGTIKKIAFNIATISGTTSYTGFTIKLGCTSAGSITSFQTGTTTVYSQTTNIALGWNSYTLTTPYNWDGTSNLLVDVCFNNTNYTYNSSTYNSTTSFTSVVYYYSDAAGNCAATTVNGSSTSRPNMRLSFCEQVVCPTITVSTSKTNPTCFGTTDGTASASATGGASPYTYNWSDGKTGASVTGMGAGTFSVTATDINGCKGVSVVTFVNPTAISSSVSENNSTCGNSNGSATVTASGGNGGFTYTWSNSQTTATATGLAPGSYTVSILDINGCSVTDTATISDISPSVTVASTNVVCNGGNNGTATATASGGLSPYSYLWNNGQTTATATGLSAGSWSVSVTDFNSCVVTGNATVSEPAVINIATTNSNVTCFGGADGSSTVNVSGGTSPYTYLWSNGQTTVTDTGLTAGTYNITVTDANSCTAAVNTTITQPATPVSASVSNVIDPSCNGSNDGSATAAASGGTSPYSFLWDNGQSGAAVTGLAAGTYIVSATDANGCTATSNATISEPAGMALTTSASLANCNASDGSASVNATGGAGGYSYLWSNGQTGATATGLAKATYTVTVTDANSCSKDTSVYVGEVGGLTAAIASSGDVDCFGGNNGVAVVTGSAGTPGYTYLWSDSAGTANDTVNNLYAGTYSVTITDNAGCTDVASVTISEPQLLSAVIDSSVNVNCFGGNDGSATVSVSGGTSPYSLLWSSGGNGFIESGLSAGLVSVNISDSNGCTASASVSIAEPATAVDVTIASSVNVNCFGGNDGSATASASGGTSGYTFLWSNGQTNVVATGLIAGTYYVTATDSKGCTDSSSVIVSQPVSALSLSISSFTNVSCFGGNDGTANAIASGGTFGYSFQWSSGGTSASETGLFAGTVYVLLTDAKGCTDTDSVAISQPLSALSATVSSTGVTCFGNANGTATVNASGGTSGYTYLWTGGGTTSTISGLAGGSYSVTVTDSKGCTSIAGTTVSSPSSALSVNISSQVNATCFGSCNGSATPAASGGTSPYSYAWNSGNGTNMCAGNYTVTVTDANGCTANTGVTITQPSSSVSVSISSQTDVTCNGASSGSATASGSGGSSPFTYSWSNSATGATATGLAAGSYTVTVTDAGGCTANTSVTINQPSAITTTTGFTPATCGNSNGTATVTPAGGNSPYTYNWSNSGTTQTISNLAAGSYNYTVTDANNCTKTGSVTVTASGSPTVTINGTNVSCNGNSNGVATAVVSGGTSPFTYFWNTNPSQTTGTATGLPAGTYSVVVTDANGCTGNQSVTITQPQPLIVNTTTTDNTGTPCNGTATAGPVGGTSPYTYFWSNGQSTQTATGLCGGSFTVTVTDANSCTQSSSATVVDNIGIDEVAGAVGVNIYPNPNNGEFMLEVFNLKSSDYELKITNILGEEVYHSMISGFSSQVFFNLAGISRGVYNLQITMKDGNISRKLIIE